jgi:hypothetical protein
MRIHMPLANPDLITLDFEGYFKSPAINGVMQILYLSGRYIFHIFSPFKGLMK